MKNRYIQLITAVYSDFEFGGGDPCSSLSAKSEPLTMRHGYFTLFSAFLIFVISVGHDFQSTFFKYPILFTKTVNIVKRLSFQRVP